jgi:hypothetical protein
VILRDIYAGSNQSTEQLSGAGAWSGRVEMFLKTLADVQERSKLI